MGQPVTERCRLDAQPRHGPAQRDRLELRHDERRQSVGQGRVDQVLVRAHAGDIGGAGLGVDPEDVGQPGDVQPACIAFGAGAEQVRGRFGKPHGGG